MEVLAIPMKEGARIAMGTFVSSNMEGLAIPSSDSPGQKFQGVAADSVHNALSDGMRHITVHRVGGIWVRGRVPLYQHHLGIRVYVCNNWLIQPMCMSNHYLFVGNLVYVDKDQPRYRIAIEPGVNNPQMSH
jgi:hypothetical protein